MVSFYIDFLIIILSSHRYRIDRDVDELEKVLDIGKAWGCIGKLVNCDGNFKYPTLTKVAKAILTIPHSNADSERVFSIVKKNAKDTRTSMKVETLSHLMQVKMRMLAEKKCCHERTFSMDFY